jgi:phytoene/squalene synthetase
MNTPFAPSHANLARDITRTASRQTYYTIRLLADPDRSEDAYRAYAYFRWVDDRIDTDAGSRIRHSEFINRQKALFEAASRGEAPGDATPEETLLIEMVHRDTEKNSGLHSYINNMMAVMAFDANRRGRLISQAELNEYTRCLATAVTEAMHYFIGHCCYSPHSEARYQAVTAAHITHMLRDTYDDIHAGYINIPHEVLEEGHISPQDIDSSAYRAWVRSRVELARAYFNNGRDYMAQVQNLRCRLAGFAYVARFERLLDTIENDQFCLRPDYKDHNGLGTILNAVRPLAASLSIYHEVTPASPRLAATHPAQRKP